MQGPQDTPSVSRLSGAYLSDRFIVATPLQAASELFRKSVVYVVSHDPVDGAVGIIINKMEVPAVRDVLDLTRTTDIPASWSSRCLLRGGARYQRFFWALRPSEAEANPILGNDRLCLLSLNEAGHYEHTAAAEPLAIGVGLVAWGPGGLNAALNAGRWLPVKRGRDLFEPDPEDRFYAALESAEVALSGVSA